MLICNRYDGGKEKGLFEGYGKARYVGGHTYVVRKVPREKEVCFRELFRVIGAEE